MKKLLMALAACATTLLASAAVKTSEGFEAGLGDFSGGGEAVAYDAGAALPLNNYPFDDAGAKYCEIDTDEQPLVSPSADGATYFDMWVQFPANASVPDPSDITNDAKLAVFVNASYYLAVVAGDGNNGTTTIDTDALITPGAWTRLTIAKVDEGFKVYIDETPVNSGATFTPIKSGNPTQAQFTGSGKLDNYVARTTDPFIQNPAAIVDGGEGFASYSEALADVLTSGANKTIAVGQTEMDGSAQKPYAITSAADLSALADAVANVEAARSKCFVQTADIDMSEAGPFPGIGTYAANLTGGVAFTGTYDGGNYTISNIDFTQRNYGGVFNQVKGGTIKDLTVSNITCSTFSSSVNSGEWGCAIVGNAGLGATLQNLTAEGDFGTAAIPCSHNVAGIAIRVCGGASNVVNGVTMLETLVKDCTNNATLHGFYTKCAGITALTQDQNGVPDDYVLFDGCVNNSNIAMVEATGSTLSKIGRDGLSGILGYVADGTKIKDCVNNGTLTSALSTAKIGGIVGWAQGRGLYDLGGNVAAADKPMIGSTAPSDGVYCPITGFQYATVDNGVATTITGAPVAGGAYLLEGNVAASETPVATLTAVGDTIAFDTALGYTFAGTVASSGAAGYPVASTSGTVTTYSAGYFPRTATAGQDGTASNPFEIADVDDLAAFQAYVDAGTGRSLCYKLTADIDASSLCPWTGIGTFVKSPSVNTYPTGKGFDGVLDGNGKTISNVTFAKDKTYGGFFNTLDGTVKNLTINVAGFEDKTVAEVGYAAFAGMAFRATFENCVATGTIGTTEKPATHTCGGFAVKSVNPVFVDCTNYVNIVNSLTDNPKIGGFIGLSEGAFLTNCWNYGNMTITLKTCGNAGNGAGGIIGYSQTRGSTIYGGGNAGTIQSTDTTAAASTTYPIYVGTIVAKAGSTITVSGGTVAQADAAPAGAFANVSGLNFATVANNVATFVADDALAAGNTYKVMADGVTATYAFAEAGTIAFDTTLYTPTYAVTADEALILSDATENNITTYTAGQAVAQVGDTKYASFQAAFDAAIASGSVVTFLSDLGETVTLDIAPGTVTIVFNPNGYSFTTPTPFAGADGVSLGAPTEVGDGTYTIVATRKKTSTWTGTAGDGLWATVENWSTGEVPDADTIVTLPDGAEIGVTGTSAIPVDSIVVNGAVALSCTGSLANNWPSIGIKGGVSGSGTLTLNRVGLASSDQDEVIVDCGIYFDGKGYDSFIDGGSFVFNGAFSGTGKFVLLSGATFNGAVTLPSGATLSVGRNGTYPNAPTFGDNSTLTGDGTIALWCNNYNAGNVFASVRSKLTNQAWTGVCELSGTMTHIDFGKYGNAGSTVRPNGLSGYLRFSAGSTTQIAVGIKALDIGSNGFTMNNQFSSGDPCNYQFDAPLTGSGTITFGTKHVNDGTAKSFYTFTGDVSGFTGVVTFGDQSYRPVVVFKAGNDEVADPTDWGQIIVTENKTVNVGAAWNSVGGYLIYGTASVTESGSLVCGAGDQKIAGDGVIRYAAVPATAPQLNGWEGTVELAAVDAGSTAKEIPLNQWGTASSKITLDGVAGNAYCASSNFTVEAALTLAGNVNFQNGSSDKTVTFRKIAAGTGNLSLKTWSGCRGITYGFTTLDADNYTGTIQLDGDKMTFKVGDILKVGAAAGDKVLNLTVANNATVNLSNATLNGEAANLELKEDGIYVAASVTPTIDPADPEPVEITAADAEAAIAAVALATPSGVDAAAYKALFDITATETSAGSGVYSVEVTGIKESVEVAVEESAMAVLAEEDEAKVVVPAGLNYKITTYTTLGGTAVKTWSGSSDGTGVSVTKPGTTQGFIKIEMSPKTFN